MHIPLWNRSPVPCSAAARRKEIDASGVDRCTLSSSGLIPIFVLLIIKKIKVRIAATENE